jgi:putative transcriptional regulator
MKNRLEELRGQKGWTQQELADIVEVSRQTIISLESGRYNPSIILAFRLSRLFNLNIEELFLYEGEENHAK